jgi:hypothetical protein
MRIRPTTTAFIATAITLALALIAIARARRMVGTENFTQGDYEAMRAALDKSDALEDAYGQKETDVFEAFLWVNSMPPTEPAMKHYVAIANRDDLTKEQLIQKMQSDMPKE